MDLAIKWIADNCIPSSRPLIVTDSQSLCKALVGCDPVINPLRLRLEQCGASVGVQWVPGHCGISGNERADKAANKAQLIPTPSRNTSLKGILPEIKRMTQDPPCRPKYQYIVQAYSKILKYQRETAYQNGMQFIWPDCDQDITGIYKYTNTESQQTQHHR